MKLQRGRWWFVLLIRKDFMRLESGWRLFRFGIFRLKHEPEEGVDAKGNKDAGFLISFRYWLPFERGV